MSSDLELFLDIAEYVSIMLEIFEFNQNWEKMYRMHHLRVRRQIRASHTYYVEFLEFLQFFKKTCGQTGHSLKNIKIQLEIANQELELNERALGEMERESERFSGSFKELHEQTKRTKNDLRKLKRDLRDQQEAIQEERCGQYSSVIVHSLTAIARISLSMIQDTPTVEGFLLFGCGAMATRMVTETHKNIKMAKMRRLGETVEDVRGKVGTLYSGVDECSQEILDMRNQLDLFVESTKLNIRIEPDTDARIRVRSNAMIVTIDALVRELERIEVFIRDATYRLRREIREVNPDALIDI